MPSGLYDNDGKLLQGRMKSALILKWFFFLLSVSAAVTAGTGLYLFSQKDAFVQEALLARFARIAPDLELTVGKALLVSSKHIELKDLEIRERSTGKLIFGARELALHLDTGDLIDRQTVTVSSVELTGASILLIREENGAWNWQQYRFEIPKQSTPRLPNVTVQDATVQLTLKHAGGIPPATLVFRDTRLQAIPDSSSKYSFDGSIELPGAGPLAISGGCSLPDKAWHLDGRLRGVTADQHLLEVAQTATPQLDQTLNRIDAAITSAVAGPARTAAVDEPVAALQVGDHRRGLQFVGKLDVDFSVSSTADQVIPDFRLLVKLSEGHVATPAIPFALTGVRARLYKDNQNLVFRLDEARGEQAALTGGFELPPASSGMTPKAWFHVSRFPVSARLRPLLKSRPRMLRLFDAFQPDLTASAEGSLVRSESGRWKLVDLQGQVHDGTILFHRFRYPVTNLRAQVTQRKTQAAGTLQQPADELVLEAQVSGTVGPRTFTSTGWLKNPGPEAESRFELSVSDFPMDSAFRNALGEKEQAVFDSLNLKGRVSAECVFYRPPGFDQPTHTQIDARVTDATVRFVSFPWDIEQLSGRVSYDSRERFWRFTELNGRHGTGKLTGEGDFDGLPAPGVLRLTVSGREVPLDSELYNALSPSQRSVWNLVNPEGMCDVTTRIHWTAAPGQPAVVEFPRDEPVRIYNTRIRPQPFPYDMLIKEASLSFDPNDPRAAGAQHCEIHDFKATHNDAPISARGWAEVKPNGEWQMHLNNVEATDLRPDDQLRAALPESWRETLARVHHTGLVSVSDSEMDFRGVVDGSAYATASWNLNLQFRDCTMNAGLDVLHVFGNVTARGVWDGYQLHNEGKFNIETAEVLEMPITNIHGPYQLNNVELVLGSRRIFEPNSTVAQIDRRERVQAMAYGGALVFDSHVDLRTDGRFQFFAELSKAKLESYAALHIPDQKDLKGVMNAWMSLEGDSEDTASLQGRGQLLINPAQLYELPVIVKLLGALSQLNLNVQDRTAFTYALVDFDVADEAFWLNSIDLVGDSISLRGRGSVDFSGAVNLDFYSQPARSRAAAIPIISGLFTNWVKIEVRGTTENPQTIVRGTARLDEGLQQFLQPFNPGGPIPGLNVPGFFQRPADRRRRIGQLRAGKSTRQPQQQQP